ncbi:ABC transporter permease [Microbacterium luticocti]|uniref:ABC transporter permease n=1 Tax=Microbacterium luticocti TaxID=451764 RepID=UPI000429FEBE|nr:FtsX-like permease family protein [Microbacterium luticocti]
MTRLAAVVREAAASARSGPVASILTILMVTGMILAIMLTTGRTVGNEQQVLGQIDSAGTRTIMIRAGDEAGITTSVLNRIAGIDGIQFAAAFSTAIDTTNSRIPGGTLVPARYAYGTHLTALGIPARIPVPGQLAYASPEALTQLGMPDAAGGITLTTGAQYSIGGTLHTPAYLADFEPVMLIPRTPDGTEPVNILLVIADTPELVGPVTTAVTGVLAATDPGKITVETSEALATLRGLIQGQLAGFGRGLVLALLAVAGVLIAILLYGLVMMRRKDYGRRRALGATRALIIGLLLTQTAILAAIGITAGVLAATVILLATGDPLPGIAFVGALAVLTVVVCLLAALLPALVASRREPIRELRVP